MDSRLGTDSSGSGGADRVHGDIPQGISREFCGSDGTRRKLYSRRAIVCSYNRITLMMLHHQIESIDSFKYPLTVGVKAHFEF